MSGKTTLGLGQSPGSWGTQISYQSRPALRM